MDQASSVDDATLNGRHAAASLGRSATDSLISTDSLILYVRQVVQTLLGATSADLDYSLFADTSDTATRLATFAAENVPSALHILKQRDAEGDVEKWNYVLSVDLEPSVSTIGSVVVIKRQPPLDLSSQLESQLQVIRLPGQFMAHHISQATDSSDDSAQTLATAAYEEVYSLVHLGIAPYFDALTKNRKKETNQIGGKPNLVDEKTGIAATKKRFTELELSLLHLQQNVEIPALVLVFHPVVQQALDRAAKLNTTPTIDMIPIDMLSDTKFLNALQANVNSWIKSIQSITRLSRDPAVSTATQEINFWISLESALEQVERQLQLDGVTLTMEILTFAKRFHVTTSFMADTGLKESTELVKKYNLFMHEFPIDELLSAPTLQKLKEAIVLIFSHINKKIRISPYPIRRALPLVEAISVDLDERMRHLLSGRRLLSLDYPEFQNILRLADDVFGTWDMQIKEFTNVAREVTRKRAEKFIPIRINARHTAIQQRIGYLKTFRQAHEQLQSTIASALSSGADEAEKVDANEVIEDLVEGYNSLKDADVLDVSTEGTQSWIAAEAAYNNRTSRIEDSIILKLRAKLATATSANEMFRVFSRFNALFIRPKIRSAIQEYQTQLIENVKTDIEALHARFVAQYSTSDSSSMAEVRDIPTVSGAIIWVRQIERQLNTYMKRVEDVLGNGWELYAEGEKLKNESTTFRKKLDTKNIYELWLRDITERKISVHGYLFNIVQTRTANRLRYELRINFDPQVITLFKEVRNLIYLKFQVPHAISSISKDAKRVYPYAMSLANTLRIYSETCLMIEELGEWSVLLNEHQSAVHRLIATGIRMNWESFIHTYDMSMLSSLPVSSSISMSKDNPAPNESKQVIFARQLTNSVTTLRSMTRILVEISEAIEANLKLLSTCAYSAESFNAAIFNTQNMIDKLNLENFFNLKAWVRELNEKIRQIIIRRLRDAITEWIERFKNSDLESSAPIKLKVTIKNQIIALSPPLEFARVSFYTEFQNYVGVLCNLKCLNASRYELNLSSNSTRLDPTFSDLPAFVPDEIAAAYNIIEQKLDVVGSYTAKWFRFQSLWDLQTETVFEMLGEDVSKWVQILQEIRQVRTTFDTRETVQGFGNIIVDYEQVQSRINAKYDSWQHSILLQFSNILHKAISDLFTDLQRTRKDLEIQTLDMSSTRRALSFVAVVQNAKVKLEPWSTAIDTLRSGQLSLSRNRFQFPQQWIFIDQLDGEWAAFRDILAIKNRTVENSIDILRSKVAAENNVLLDQTTKAITSWNADKPITGTITPADAFITLQKFDKILGDLQRQQDLIVQAKSSLLIDLPINGLLEPALLEVQDFKSVWSALSTVWQSLDELRDLPWASVAPRKVKSSVDELMVMTKEMPSRMRQYASFEYVQGVLRQLLKSGPILNDLKSDVIHDRHWERLWKACELKDNFHMASLTLGKVWDINLNKHEAIIRDIVAQARGEIILENFLKQTRDSWTEYNLDLVNYQNKCMLIRSWDTLLERCSENMTSLAAMHHSPYFKQFEEETLLWEDRLNRVNALFDLWMGVQRQWVYLEGVFSGNAEIKTLLPIESSRFQNVNSEFFALMRKVSKMPGVMDVLNIQGARTTLERLSDLLLKIQRALGEYLEQERANFPRYYFVGDEDLLDIIGNGKDVLRIQKHFKKMFAGMSELLIDSQTSTITGFCSREGEEVMLHEPISLIKMPSVNNWLTKLESAVQETLASYLKRVMPDYISILDHEALSPEQLISWIDRTPAQIVILASQIVWTSKTETALLSPVDQLLKLTSKVSLLLESLAIIVLQQIDRISRRKCEGLVTELVHQRNVLQKLALINGVSKNHYGWISCMRFYYNEDAEPVRAASIVMGSASFDYGFEYIGAPDRLVQTPLTDKCFLALTSALEQSFGGSPIGPAGTGKTETVKALGALLGRYVLVFNCDDSFNFKALGRIFLGICQVGAWGCFDEFNRLNEHILSAVSSQIQTIQMGLRAQKFDNQDMIEILERRFQIHANTGIFITMNPGYAGRSNLPDNLKKLFRTISMSRPDKELITEVILYSQGFFEANAMATKVIPFFDLLSARLSPQPHYDFGLRALKSVLGTSGTLKRQHTANESNTTSESEILLRSIHETVAPKLVGDDVQELIRIEADVFPKIQYIPEKFTELRKSIVSVAESNGFSPTTDWIEKCIQVYQMQAIHHGVMMVGSSGSGKTAIWQTLLRAMHETDGQQGIPVVIDPKVMSKESLYGSLDTTTREWTDGLFTKTLRQINNNLRGEIGKRYWIIFDGDIDPEWAENLNSVLDDNKILTLPTGEKLSLTPNIRIFFEVSELKYATLATISRCGIIWFSNNIVSSNMLLSSYVRKFSEFNVNSTEGFITDNLDSSTILSISELLESFVSLEWIDQAIEEARKYTHIMEYSSIRALCTLFSLMNSVVREILDYDLQHIDFSLSRDQKRAFLLKKLLLNVIWSFVGDCTVQERELFAQFVCGMELFESSDIPAGESVLDYDVSLPHGKWVAWQSLVPRLDLDPHTVSENKTIIPTVDTVRHEALLHASLRDQRPLILCGPPGSGKTMSLFNCLRKFSDIIVAGINFSSATSPDLVVKTMEQYCDYRKINREVILSPSQLGRRLVLFCDEINLPTPDKYGTQSVITFLRQLIERKGFWRTKDNTWVSIERIQFVGACNPPTDIGRTELGSRILTRVSVVMIDYPAEISLTQIYGTIVAAVLKSIPSLRGYADALTSAMIDFYLASQKRFTAQDQSHYIYSPRELTRWVQGLHESISPLDGLSLEGLVRIWAHEAMRLFSDRLVTEEERIWTESKIWDIAKRHFVNINCREALKSPILYSNWLAKNYVPVTLDDLKKFVNSRLKTFCEEELDISLVFYDDALDHILRIDRVFRQPQGHMILIGLSGSGKTTLTRFVAWMNGLKVFQINSHKKYTAADFDEDLRQILRASGCKSQQVCFILDESNVLGSAFLERMNTLLANAEIPGLFEGDEYTSLLAACRDGARQQGLILESVEELHNWFREQVVRNLHVVFTMNPPKKNLASQAAASPALFNRCVLNWMGDWSASALYQVGQAATRNLDIDIPSYQSPNELELSYRELSFPLSHRQAVVNAMVYMHESMKLCNDKLLMQQRKHNYTTPRHFLEFLTQFVKVFDVKRSEVEDQQRHLNVGLEKLRDTVEKVRHMRTGLAEKRDQLQVLSARANEKLQQIIMDQNETEQKRAESLEVQADLAIKEQEIAARQAVVLNDLAKAEPAVVEAQQSVSNIKKQHLTEVRSMANPPETVKMAMEAVCTLLGHRVDSWRTVQSIIRREDFISSVVNFDCDRQMTLALRTKMINEYLSRPNFNFDTVNRASKACGPLTLWVEAQINYSMILERVGPLRQEVAELTASAESTKSRLVQMDQIVQELEMSIEKFKDEYAMLISEVQEIKGEMTKVEFKVNRSVKLLSNLASERERWRLESVSFEEQTQTLTGDALLSAGLLVYGGFFDQQFRQQMQSMWRGYLGRSHIAFKEHNDVVPYLTTIDEKNAWHNNSLPSGELCEENALMLEWSTRYPLIIDPTGSIVEFLKNQNVDRGVITTSLVDNAFVKQLDSALRFGNTLVVNDAEHFDPILNRVLNKEYQRIGGRVLVRLGNQDIDFSPNFRLYLCTRDSSVSFPAHIASKVALINFTTTRSNLLAESLNNLLKVLRPDIDRKRGNLLKLRRDFTAQLRNLERNLLQVLNDSQSSILEDDNVVNTLEVLKVEGSDISQKMEETEAVMSKIESITQQYYAIAEASSTIFTILGLLQKLNPYYQFSLDFFHIIFMDVLGTRTNTKDSQDLANSIREIIIELYVETCKRTSQTLLQADILVLQAFMSYAYLNKCDISLLESLLQGTEQQIDISAESYELLVLIEHSKTLPSFEKYNVVDVDSLNAFVYKAPDDQDEDIDEELYRILLLKLMRSGNCVSRTHRFVSRAFGLRISQDEDIGILGTIVTKQVTMSTPIVLCSVPGYDASYKIENFVTAQGIKCTSIALGSEESTMAADRAIAEAASNGHWVLLKNVHLAPSWLDLWAKRMHMLQLSSSFRLFLSMEMTRGSPPPIELLRSSRILTFEPPPGIRANMRDSLASISSDEISADPVERTRLYFLLSWFHAVVQERARYGTSGWNKFYDFTNADYEFARYIIDKWLLQVCGSGRSNVAPENIPWEIIREFIAFTVYGGQVDDVQDQENLNALAARVFDLKTFDLGYELAEGHDKNGGTVTVPEGSKVKDFVAWIESLPEREPARWLGLAEDVTTL
ncbi:dynein heavy chain, N-terminal region 1-domain-containing protein [Limtongia smithiae]|uniref:dynein heavy chain, N-terminal region 1-domain-containing protein n=1 Tax=Limtongia smithiae TaxID=1125753 RepID=UPI0034CD5FFD